MTAIKLPAMRVQTLLKLSVVAALITILMKSAAWWLTDSVGLLSDALESFVNLASALFAILMVTIAARPADEDHPSGHSKAEYFSSGFEGLLIVGAALGIVWAAVDRFMHNYSLHALGWGIGLSVVSSGLNGALAWRMLKASREHRSIVLEADARHLITDVWTSAGVVLGLGLVHLTGWLWIDPLLAIGVAINILREGLHLAWRSVEGLMDSAVEPDVRAKIDSTLAQFAKKSVRFDHVVTRRAGQRRFVDMHMHTPDHWTLGHAAELRNRVEQALMQAVPGLRASIQLLPMHLEAHCHTEPDLLG
jgi:cation diffusion facilitator family transporter